MTTPAMSRVLKARSTLVIDQPFWGVLALRLSLIEAQAAYDMTRQLTPVETVAIDTMAVDGKHLFFNAAFVMRLSEAKLVGMIAHEVEHVARGHHVRRGNRDPDLWNIACDHSINTNLKRGGFELPGPAELDGADICSDPQFDGMAAEEIYSVLAQQQAQSQQSPQPQQQGDEQQTGSDGASDQSGADQDSDDGQAGNSDQGQGQASPNAAPSQSPQNGQGQASTGQGSDSSGQGQDASGAPAQGDGAGNQGQAQGAASSPGQASPKASPSNFGKVLDFPGDDLAKGAEARDVAVKVRQASMVAKAQGRGTMPGAIAEIISDIGKPRIDWRAAVRRFADDASVKQTDWTRVSRRQKWSDGAPLMPGRSSIIPGHLVAIIDTSLSMDVRALQACGAELQGLLDEGACDRITVLYADTAPRRFEAYARGDRFELTATGRGGTDFRPALAWCDDNAPDAAAILYLTDMDGAFPAVPPYKPVLWLSTDPRRTSAPFGEVIPIDAHA